LNPPTEKTTHGTVMKCRRHLDALVTLYAVEFLFVAWTVMHEGFVEPAATLDS